MPSNVRSFWYKTRPAFSPTIFHINKNQWMKFYTKLIKKKSMNIIFIWNWRMLLFISVVVHHCDTMQGGLQHRSSIQEDRTSYTVISTLHCTMILGRILTALQSPLAKCIGVSSSMDVMSFVLCNLRFGPFISVEISGESIFRVAQHRIEANLLFLACVRIWGCSHFHSWPRFQSFGPQKCNHTK